MSSKNSIFKLLSVNILFTRNISRGFPKLTQTPVVSYNNAQEQKSLIFKENLNKSFVYRWTNKVNGKEYLGSTTNAKRRLFIYFNIKSLQSANMPIYKAILKHGHSNFIFDIIEYCETIDTIKREQFYLDHFDFYYNVLEKADSLLGYKHTSKTLAKMKGRKNALGYKHTLETISKLRKYQQNKKHSVEALIKMSEVWANRKFKSKEVTEKELHTQNRTKIKGKIVLVTNINSNISTEYLSISEAASALNITRLTLRNYVKNKTVFNVLKQDPSGNRVLKESFLIKVKDTN